MKKLLVLILILFGMAQTVFASDTSVDGIYYDFDTSKGTATVTFRGAAYNSYSGEYSGSVTIPESVTYDAMSYAVVAIKAGAFYDCPSLTSVVVPSGVTTIGSNAFYNCSGLLIVNIPNTVTSIGLNVFYGCDNLMYNAYGNEYYLGNTSNPYYALVKAQSTSISSCDIQPACVIIAGSAFEGCTSLSGVTIPSGVTSIGENAFYNCASLDNVVIPSGVTKVENSTFQGCVSLNSVTIPNTVTSIGEYAFSYCTGMTGITLPTSLKSIEDNAFEGCTSLSSMAIPSGVLSIGDDVFNGCSSMSSIAIPNSVTSIGEYAFNGCTSLLNVTLPYYVESVNRGTFYNCTGLSTINIPENVTAIENRAFYNCSSLGNVVVPDGVSIIGDDAFYGCTTLSSVNIPEGVSEIGDRTFYNCPNLASIVIPSSATAIGEDAFNGCESLTNIIIPSGVTSIGGYAFKNCTNLSNVTCWAMTPPECAVDPKFNYTGTLLVHAESIDAYKSANFWKNFTYVNAIPGTQCQLTVQVNDVSFGSATGTGKYDYNSIATIKATPFPGYHFVMWEEDENVEAQRTITVTTALTYTAVFALDTFEVSAVPNDVAYGSVTGGGEYFYNETATLNAIASTGYHFVKWNDDVTTNPRNVTVVSDSSFTAVFEIDTYTIEALSNNNLFGGVTGGGDYDYNETATLNAIANTGYHFVQWNDGSTVNPRNVTVVSDSTLTATFEIDTYTVTVLANEGSYGTTDGGGEYEYGSSATISATPVTGCHFVQWNDDVTTNPRTFTVDRDTTFTATFEINTYLVTLTSNNDSYGTTSGSGTYNYGSVATLTAIPSVGYHFVRWSDGNTSISRSETITSDVNLEAEFEINQYTVEVYSNNGLYGSVTGGGTFEHGTTTSITATPESGYHFVQWSDGSVVPNRTITVTKDSVLTAIFEVETYTITALSSDIAKGSVSGGGYYAYNETATLTPVPSTGYYFVQWQDGNTSDPRTFAVTGNASYTATFAIRSYTVSVASGGNGTVDGGGVFNYGMTTTLTATPDAHYHFVQWSDGNSENPRPISVESDWNLTATFAIDQVTVTASPSEASYGYVTGGGTYDYGASVTLTATANEGHSFVRWTEDGNTSSSRTFLATEDVTYTAEFSVNQYTVTLTNATPLYGSVTGGGTYDYNATATLKAIPSVGYHFTGWSDGNCETTRVLTVTKDTALTATFEIDTYSVTATPNNLLYGTTTGTGFYDYGETATLTAIANDGYRFDHWSDGNLDVTRSFVVTGDMTVEAVFVVCNFTVTVTPIGNGTVSGAGTFNCGATATLTATPDTHHHLVEWSDGETDNPRNVTTDMTLTATFAVDSFEVVAESDDDTYGIVSGSGDYAYNTTATLIATPLPGHYFVKWTDGFNSATRYVTVKSDTSFMAIFEAYEYVVTLSVNDEDFGSVSGEGTFTYGETAQLKANANDGYEFVNWSDGCTSNSYSLVVTSDSNLIATFALKTYTVTLTSNNESYGGVSGAGVYNHGDVATLKATAIPGYEFIRWSDGNVNPTRTETITSDITLQAIFDVASYTLTAVPNDIARGSVSGGGTYGYNEVVTLSATASTGYHFEQWNDGQTAAKRVVNVTSDTVFTAYFVIDKYYVSAVADDDTHGSVTGEGTYDYGTQATLTATANAGYHFVRWNDGVTSSTRNVTVTSDTSFVAEFEIETYTITVVSNNEEYGMVSGGGTYDYGSVVVLTATVLPGYRFVRWNDGNTDPMRVITVTASDAFIAEFALPESYSFDSFKWAEDSLSAKAVFVDDNDVTNRREMTASVSHRYQPADCDNTGYSEYVALYVELGVTYTDTLRQILTIKTKNIIKRMWNDVVTIIDPDHEYVSYEWYQNGNLTSDAPYVSESPYLTGSYRLIATTESGEPVCSNILNFQELRSSSSLKAYPNPACDYVTIEGGHWKIGDEVLLLNGQGQVEARHIINREDKFTIALYGLDGGVYYLKVNEESVKVIIKK